MAHPPASNFSVDRNNPGLVPLKTSDSFKFVPIAEAVEMLIESFPATSPAAKFTEGNVEFSDVEKAFFRDKLGLDPDKVAETLAKFRFQHKEVEIKLPAQKFTDEEKNWVKSRLGVDVE